MQLELPVRWSETDKESTKKDKLLYGEDAIERIKYSYGKLLIDSGDVGPYYDIDQNHTMINDKLGKLYCVTIPIDQFKKIMTEITGKAIMILQVRQEYSQTPAPRRRRTPKKDDEDDNILN